MEPGAKPLRLFIALFPEASFLRDDLPPPAPGLEVTPIPQQNWHITTLFVGDTPAHKLEKVQDAMRSAASAHRQFSLRFHKFSLEGLRANKALLWARFRPHRKLQEIHDELFRKADKLGLNIKHRAVTPHITLARLRGESRAAMSAARSNLSAPAFSVLFDHLCLVRSNLSPQGSAYTKILACDLAGTGCKRTRSK